ncbi:Cadherin-related family member 5 [Frankliniella fusca]|uniref:Cadherin-related family member 5 n=1 Tax=Frankliniella fusca TaxID=407009 RepID=A0AAE1LMP0_9NEOP|nr:Cadherin-related family member 5 [Frankliniella fusca]
MGAIRTEVRERDPRGPGGVPPRGELALLDLPQVAVLLSAPSPSRPQDTRLEPLEPLEALEQPGPARRAQPAWDPGPGPGEEELQEELVSTRTPAPAAEQPQVGDPGPGPGEEEEQEGLVSTRTPAPAAEQPQVGDPGPGPGEEEEQEGLVSTRTPAPAAEQPQVDARPSEADEDEDSPRDRQREDMGSSDEPAGEQRAIEIPLTAGDSVATASEPLPVPAPLSMGGRGPPMTLSLEDMDYLTILRPPQPPQPPQRSGPGAKNKRKSNNNNKHKQGTKTVVVKQQSSKQSAKQSAGKNKGRPKAPPAAQQQGPGPGSYGPPPAPPAPPPPDSYAGYMGYDAMPPYGYGSPVMYPHYPDPVMTLEYQQATSYPEEERFRPLPMPPHRPPLSSPTVPLPLPAPAPAASPLSPAAAPTAALDPYTAYHNRDYQAGGAGGASQDQRPAAAVQLLGELVSPRLSLPSSVPERLQRGFLHQVSQSVVAAEHHSTHDGWPGGSSGTSPSTTGTPADATATAKKATLKDILAQDCPSAEELGYCDSPPRYPIAGPCLPDDSGDRSRNSPVLVVCGGAVSRGRRQISPIGRERSSVETLTVWSRIRRQQVSEAVERCSHLLEHMYAPPLDERDPEGESEGEGACQSVRRSLRPGYVRDASSGRWLVALQARGRVVQKVSVERCSAPGRACARLADSKCARNLGFRNGARPTACDQRTALVPVITWDPEAPAACPRLRMARFPVACVCRML